jgi:seryl-tRNA synthetase
LQNDFQVERNELNSKLQELLVHNEKSKDEYLKKVIVYREKYGDYKNKVKSSNNTINTLLQRVARYEMEL